MEVRITVFWILSVLTLMACLALNHSQTESNPKDDINLVPLLKVKPNYFSYYENKYHARVFNQLSIEINSEPIQQDLTTYDTIIIEGLELSLNALISLSWDVNGETKQILINHHSTSINHIDFDANYPEEIQNLQLTLYANHELGTQNIKTTDIAFSGLILRHSANLNQLSAASNEWFDFTPIKFSSINGYSSPNDLHMQSLIARLLVWLVINLIIYTVLGVNGKHLIGSLTLAWLLVAIPFLWNQWLQNQQIKQAFPHQNLILNSQDQQAFELAQEISGSLNALSEFSVSKNKLLIIGSNNFEFLRLFHHLHHLNIALSLKSDVLSTHDGANEIIYILSHTFAKFCSVNENNTLFPNGIDVLSSGNNFCLVKRK